MSLGDRETVITDITQYSSKQLGDSPESACCAMQGSAWIIGYCHTWNKVGQASMAILKNAHAMI